MLKMPRRASSCTDMTYSTRTAMSGQGVTTLGARPTVGSSQGDQGGENLGCGYTLEGASVVGVGTGGNKNKASGAAVIRFHRDCGGAVPMQNGMGGLSFNISCETAIGTRWDTAGTDTSAVQRLLTDDETCEAHRLILDGPSSQGELLLHRSRCGW